MNNGRGESGERRVTQCDHSVVFTRPIQDNNLNSNDLKCRKGALPAPYFFHVGTLEVERVIER